MDSDFKKSVMGEKSEEFKDLGKENKELKETIGKLIEEFEALEAIKIYPDEEPERSEKEIWASIWTLLGRGE